MGEWVSEAYLLLTYLLTCFLSHHYAQLYHYARQESRDAAAGGGMLNGRWRLQREKRLRKSADGS